MNYLVIEGFKDVAEKFSQEINIKPPVNLQTIEDRMKIKELIIQHGNIEDAIDQTNDLNLEVSSVRGGLPFTPSLGLDS